MHITIFVIWILLFPHPLFPVPRTQLDSPSLPCSFCAQRNVDQEIVSISPVPYLTHRPRILFPSTFLNPSLHEIYACLRSRYPEFASTISKYQDPRSGLATLGRRGSLRSMPALPLFLAVMFAILRENCQMLELFWFWASMRMEQAPAW